MIAFLNRILLVSALFLVGVSSGSAEDALTDRSPLMFGSDQTTPSPSRKTAIENRLAQLIHERVVENHSNIPRSFGFQGQCTIDDDCGTWKCCSTSCEDVDVCP